MKIRVAMLDNDHIYLTKIAKVLNMKYSQKLELYIFSTKEMLIESLKNKNVHVLIVNRQLFNLNDLDISTKMAKAYLVESESTMTLEQYNVVNKFQKIEDMYLNIQELYMDTFKEGLVSRKFSESTVLLVYTSFCGGTGTSTIAISEAITKAKMGAKVLYLNLEYFDTTDMYFPIHEKLTFSNLVFEVKKGDSRLVSKLESIFVKDESGVYYCSPSNILLDKLEMNNKEDIQKLFSALKQLDFEYIIIDRNISFTVEERIIFDLCDQIRFVVDGRQITIQKFLKLMNSLALLDQREDKNICEKVGVIYNKMSSSYNNTIQDHEIKILATINKYQTREDKMIVEEIVSKNVLANI